MTNRTGSQTAPPGPAGSCPPQASAVHSQPEECHDHDGYPEADHQTSLDTYIAGLVDAARPLSSQQRDTLSLLLRRPRTPGEQHATPPRHRDRAALAGIRRPPAAAR
jgi:hypothetical protein